jgi:AAA+ ATPase superfamily predicted ATPase
MEFVNRREELRALADWWERDSRPAFIWGRRRVGKSALIERFAESTGARVIFHTGAGRPGAGELAMVSRRAAAVTRRGIRDPLAVPYRDWDDALEHIADQADEEPLLLVLDEFPELMATTPELPGILRAFLDRLPAASKLKIIICGSAVRSMEALREYRAPLYGRFDLTLHVHPFRPHEAAEMLPALSPADRAVAYGIMGGIPLYLSWWNQDQPVRQNLLRLACQPGGRLQSEGRLILATEADRGELPGATLNAIANGATRFSEISNAIGTNPTRTLDRLAELRLIERISPVTDSERHSKQRIYRIADEFLAFYLGPLSRYQPEIERGLGSSIVDAVLDRMDDYMGDAYENAFRHHLRRLANRGELGPKVVAIGPWWTHDGNDQIDAIVMAEQDMKRVPVLAGECKWAKQIDASRVKAKLIRKAASLTAESEQLKYCVCAREEVINADADTLTITAADVFGTE